MERYKELFYFWRNLKVSIFSEVLLLGTIVGVLTLADSEFPIQVHRWEAKAKTTGGYLLAPINLNFIADICNDFLMQLTTASNGFLKINQANFDSFSKQFINQMGFLTVKLENNYKGITEYIHNLMLCPSDTMSLIYAQLATFQRYVDTTWVKFNSKNKLGITQELQYIRPPPKPQICFRPFLMVVARTRYYF